MSFPERCKMCGKRDKFSFQVSDEIWAAVIPEPMQGYVACLACFDALAAQKGVNYANDIDTAVVFGGDAAWFNLNICQRMPRPGPG